MRWFHCAVMACVVVGLAVFPGRSAAQKKELTNKEKIVGIWEITKSAEAPAGSTVEFTKDGKLKFTINLNNKQASAEGTYTVDGDSINAIGPKGEKETIKIKKLTDTELITEDAKGKVDEFKRVKKQ
jgi:uncharacterized protein (TIGR03066 family)